jgi:hypothetical protein
MEDSFFQLCCIAYHGADGKRAPETSTVFVRPDTWPAMTRCDQTTPEPDSAYRAVILHGDRGLGFSQIMPAFGDLLSNDIVQRCYMSCNENG